MSSALAFIPEAIFTSLAPPETHTALVWDGKTVIDIVPENELGKDFAQRKIDGWLCPGFVNTHCHLELSWAKGFIKQQTGINQFIIDLLGMQSNQPIDIIQQSIIDAMEQSIQSGTSFIADIANGSDTLPMKFNEKRMGFHTFIELFGFNPVLASSKIKAGTELKQKFHNQNQSASLTPHAPYSVSKELLSFISKEEKTELFSIHFRESLSEDEFFVSKSGAIAERLKQMNIGFEHWNVNQTPLSFLFSELNPSYNYLWVHNTFITPEDFEMLEKNKTNHWFCLCPRANQFIEGTLPPIDQIANFTNQITIGTDSLASNHDLSVWNEIKTIQHAFPNIPAQDLILWATANGADLFQQNNLGRLKKGYSGSIAHIQQPGQDLNKIHPESFASLLKLM